MVARAAEALGKPSVLIEDSGDEDLGYYGTDMVLVANRKEDLEKPRLKGFTAPKVEEKVRLWTDDYSNLFRILR